MESFIWFVHQHGYYLLIFFTLVVSIIVVVDKLTHVEDLRVVPEHDSTKWDGVVMYRLSNGVVIPRHFRFDNRTKPRRLSVLQCHDIALRLQAMAGVNYLAIPDTVALNVPGREVPLTYSLQA